ncbi:polymorphic toxin-type HINT domain-containing protein [Streptomyces lancefieldiae]|uniref:Polymorphic toxin-type HINT domain-containing protein n=1 Tax=Streptomyces lancefieldiae TaxID=3075520 RepID=A0ABU3AYE6_9ACTN|nr:polymorphic toxin-type HINT domain-containing protein [Streptomyces sp. DSM 40712]MDT0614895.1 polymorphic toxin-type HINT domain-containing protein [Streptomyces sp. DSM 40712]
MSTRRPPARDAANSAADHAEKAAAAADLAAEHAGEAATAAAESTKHAEAAKTAADAATAAVVKARATYDLARQVEAAELADRTTSAIEEAKAAKVAVDERKAAAQQTAEQVRQNEEEAERLAVEVSQPGVDVAVVVPKARKVALHIAKTRGPWSATAAEVALAGSDSDVVEYVRTGRELADQHDEADRVARLAWDSEYPAVRSAAQAALAGDAAAISAFLETGQHQAAASDYRIRVVQLMDGAGPEVRREAQAALDAGDTQALRDFVSTGYYTARNSDERVRAVQLMNEGAPELKAAARVALEGPSELLHDFIEVGQFRAQRKDLLAATHVSRVQRLIAGAASVAATAQQNAALAAKVAAEARKAAADAEDYAAQAEASKKQADTYAEDARKSAAAAEASAAQASESARKARAAEADAHAAAQRATNSASQAEASAASAAASANDAWNSAAAARASAEAAGKDSAAAQQAAKDALIAAVEKKQAEELAKLKNEEAKQFREEIKAFNDWLRESEDIDWGEVLSEGGHFALDVLGLVPGFGEVADGANCAWYGGEAGSGEKDALGDAALSCAAAVPGIGYGASAVKFGKWGDKASGFFKSLFSKGSKVFKKCNSFTPETPVLLGDGRTTKAIKDLEVGDNVLATDPVTDRTAARPVDRLFTTTGLKSLVSITIDQDGAAGDAVGTFTATAGHPIWLVNRKHWVHAENVVEGDSVRTPDGTTATVVATQSRNGVQQVFNLSVRDIHTYYVLAGRTPVLVHNATCPVTFADMGGDHFVSPGGLIYGPDRKHGHKIDHLLRHTVEDPSRLTHTVFIEKEPNKVLALVDEAWAKQSEIINVPGDIAVIIPMGKVIGTKGEDHMRIAIDPNSGLFLSAYPVPKP